MIDDRFVIWHEPDPAAETLVQDGMARVHVDTLRQFTGLDVTANSNSMCSLSTSR
jgi:hypothetical protein